MQFQFSNLADFFSMNGHGPYVWASYLVVLVVMFSLAIVPALRMRKMRRDLVRQRQTEARRRQQRSDTGASSVSAAVK